MGILNQAELPFRPCENANNIREIYPPKCIYFLPLPPFSLSCFPAEKHHGNSVGLALLYRIRLFCPLHTISTKSARGKRVWEHFHSSGIRYARAMLRAGIVRIGEE